MQEDTILQRLKKLKGMIVSSNIPNNMLLEIIEGYLTSDGSDDNVAVEDATVFEGQLSLLDYEFCE